jgi:hypothetical protein
MPLAANWKTPSRPAEARSERGCCAFAAVSHKRARRPVHSEMERRVS